MFDETWGPLTLASNSYGNHPCGGTGAYTKFEDDFLSAPSPTFTGNSISQIKVCGLTSGAGGGAMDNVPNVGACP